MPWDWEPENGQKQECKAFNPTQDSSVLLNIWSHTSKFTGTTVTFTANVEKQRESHFSVERPHCRGIYINSWDDHSLTPINNLQYKHALRFLGGGGRKLLYLYILLLEKIQYYPKSPQKYIYIKKLLANLLFNSLCLLGVAISSMP